jgi:hypothetical protein
MTNVLKLSAGLLLAATMLGGCIKDDDESAGSLIYDSKESALETGFLAYYEKSGDDAYNMDLYLISPGLEVKETAGYPSFSGAGNLIYLSVYSGSYGNLTAGIYSYNKKGGIANTFDDGGIGIDVKGGDVNAVGDAVTEGTLIVALNDMSYDITFNGKTAGGKSFSGTFKNTLKYYDCSSNTLKSAKPNRIFRFKK